MLAAGRPHCPASSSTIAMIAVWYRHLGHSHSPWHGCVCRVNGVRVRLRGKIDWPCVIRVRHRGSVGDNSSARERKYHTPCCRSAPTCRPLRRGLSWSHAGRITPLGCIRAGTCHRFVMSSVFGTTAQPVIARNTGHGVQCENDAVWRQSIEWKRQRVTIDWRVKH
jgi:hypothetical protein